MAATDSYTQRLRLTLVISSLGAGGAERVMANLANHWVGKGWSITLLTLDDGRLPPFYDLHPEIQHLKLSLYAESITLWQKISRNIRRLLILRRKIAASHPQVVLSFNDRTNVLVLAATRLLFVPVVVAEHIHPAAAPLGRVWETLRRCLYPRASSIVTLTERSAEYFPASWRTKIEIIPNPVLTPEREYAPNHSRQNIVVAMGRLVPQKGFDLLIDAFAQIAPEFHGWRLVLLGEGPLREELENQVHRLSLEDKVLLAGVVPRPDTYLRQAQLFVLSSRFEGFPMALCEAMANGVPVVAADCPTGPREILRPGVDGLLVVPEDVAALAHAMATLMADAPLRHEMGRRAREIVARYSLEEVDQKWERLFKGALAER